MSMIRIVYYSERNPTVGLDMKKLLDTSQRNNVRDGIGGFLHYNGLYFLQALEGEQSVVAACYGRIEKDPSHHNIVVIGAEVVTERKFERWGMGLAAGVGYPSKETFIEKFSASEVDPSILAAIRPGAPGSP